MARIVKTTQIAVVTLTLVLCLSIDARHASADVQATEWWVQYWALPYVQSDWGAPADLHYDRQAAEMYMTDPKRQRVLVFDANGLESYRFNHPVIQLENGRALRGEPRDLVVSADGLIYLTDFLSDKVSILNYRGERVGQLDISAAFEDAAGDIRAVNLATGPEEIIYVSTAGSRAGILGFDAHDRVVRRIGYDLEGYERINNPSAMAVDRQGDLWVADLDGFPVIRHYSKGGRFLGGFGDRDVGRSDFSYPSDILCADDGTLWVADALRQAVKHLTADGDFIELIGGYGSQAGALQYPSALAGDGVSEIYVCERVGRRVQRYLPAARVTGGVDHNQAETMQ